jgi:capsular polysaccharide transport system permease protein
MDNNRKSIGSRLIGVNGLFLMSVVIPTALAALYFGLIASDVYVSESRFVVRSPERQTTSPLGVFLNNAGFSRSQDDSYTVQDFILSRDALKVLDEKLGVAGAFGSNKIDVFSRFAGLDWDKSFEALHRYYQKHVDVRLDTTSSIITLATRAFSADEAWRMNQMLLDLSESLVNRLNERGRQDLIRSASVEVDAAERKTKEAALALSDYRNKKGVIDPEKQSSIQLQQVAKLQDEMIAAKTQLAQLTMLARDNPQIPVLKKQLEVLQSAISAETTSVAGGERSLARKAADYQRLALDREFADKQLATALASLEHARNEAQRKQLYLERIVQASMPDVATEPRRVRGTLVTFIVGLMAWGILSLLVAGVREHQE